MKEKEQNRLLSPSFWSYLPFSEDPHHFVRSERFEKGPRRFVVARQRQDAIHSVISLGKFHPLSFKATLASSKIASSLCPTKRALLFEGIVSCQV